jgi:hypothetical protein
MSDMFKVKIVTPDGQQFDSKAEAAEHMRRPKIKTALTAVTAGNAQTTDWLLDNRDAVEAAFDVGVIRRVTKSERKKLEKAVEHLKTLTDEPKLAFLVENAAIVAKSFRWPKVDRMTDEQKAVAARNTLIALTENEGMADWILANKDAVVAAFKAGIEKKQPSAAATSGLDAYRQRKAAEKAANAGKEKASA